MYLPREFKDMYIERLLNTRPEAFIFKTNLNSRKNVFVLCVSYFVYYEKWGLIVNMEEESQDIELKYRARNITTSKEYKYLRVKIVKHGRYERDIEEQIGNGRQPIRSLNTVTS